MSRYILVETAISVAINAAISACFAFLVFGGRTGIALWGSGGLALDFAPQTFMIAMMSVVVPTSELKPLTTMITGRFINVKGLTT